MTEITVSTDKNKIRLWQALPEEPRPNPPERDLSNVRYHLGVPVMTELSLTPQPHPINPAAFIFALIAAPMSTGLAGIFLVATIGTLELNFGIVILLGLVMAGATVVGGIPYLVIGVPGLLYALRTYGRHAPFGRFAMLGHICSLPLILFALFALGTTEEIETTLVYGVLGGAFAPIWGTLFAAIYFSIVDEGERNV